MFKSHLIKIIIKRKKDREIDFHYEKRDNFKERFSLQNERFSKKNGFRWRWKMFDFWKKKKISRDWPGPRIFQIKWSLRPLNILTIVHELQMLWWKHGHRPWWFQEKDTFSVDYFLNIYNKILGLKLVELLYFHTYSLPLKHSGNSNSHQYWIT